MPASELTLHSQGLGLGSWYTVFKKIKGKLYAYSQRSWREGKKVRVESRYMGGGSAAAALAKLAEAAGGSKLTLRQEPALKLATLPQAEALSLWHDSKLGVLQKGELPRSARKALEHYSGPGYRKINAALRGDIPLTPALKQQILWIKKALHCLLYTSPSPRDRTRSRMPSSA